ncbi:protein dj-1beta-like isoform X1 [Vespa crabro]|uniref:protein dj-1beta-like isoform X1 n=2 Tax=Vespa crabro TaxID=7445 RepID=UPI001F00B643|nr:protein dj-1beta-like isoform X1 [Vespa crabro]XP_046820163.1 protein dj-1beta-like isoform X1 [Vespa crabro]
MRIAIQLYSLFLKNSKPVWRSSAYNFRYTAKYSNKMAEKTALLLISDGSEEMEAVITADVLRRGGVSVTIASLGDSECVKCSREVKICADTKLANVNDKEKYDVIILPGGLGGAKAFAESAEVGQLLQKQEKENKLIAAICAAPTALKAHGIAKGKKITSYPAMKDQMTDGYEYLEDRVVIDGNLITSRGPATAFAFGLALVEKLVSKEKAINVAKGMLYEDYK